METAIVTGCTGQAGSYFADYLLENTDLDVVGAVRRLSVSNHSNINHIDNPRFKVETMDLTDSRSINDLVKKYKPKYFINAAANSFVGSSWKLPLQHFDINAVGVLRVLEAIREFSPATRFYNFGSSEEWGDVVYTPQNENHPARARSPYGASKIAARQLVKVYRESYGLYAIQGWSLNYESERRGEEFVTRKITKGVARIANNTDTRPIELGNLDARRDWSHALDIVEGVWRMLNQEVYNPELEIYNNPKFSLSTPLSFKVKEYVLSSGEQHSIRDFAEIAFQKAGIRGYWDYEDLGSTLSESFISSENEVLIKINPEFYRPADVETLCGSSLAIKSDLGWEPKIAFDELVNRMVNNDLLLERKARTSDK
jgi:GDPmannose 4,6-dehydratase